MNPASRDATIDVTLMFEDSDPRSPEALRDVVVGAGLRREIGLDRWTSGDAAWALIQSDAPVVTERTALDRESGDPAAVMGVPLRPAVMGVPVRR
jgi:hypothetical protein